MRYFKMPDRAIWLHHSPDLISKLIQIGQVPQAECRYRPGKDIAFKWQLFGIADDCEISSLILTTKNLTDQRNHASRYIGDNNLAAEILSRKNFPGHLSSAS